MVHTLRLGLTPDHTAMVLTLATYSAHTASHDDIPLLRLVPKTMSLIGSGGTMESRDAIALTIFPGADTA